MRLLGMVMIDNSSKSWEDRDNFILSQENTINKLEREREKQTQTSSCISFFLLVSTALFYS